MPAMTLRNIPEDVHRALKARAARHGRSAEAELRVILTEAVQTAPVAEKGLGTLMHEAFKGHYLSDEEMKYFERDRSELAMPREVTFE